MAELFNRLLCGALGAGGAALLIAIHSKPTRRGRPRALSDWHRSLGGAHRARQVAQAVMEDWQEAHGPMSGLQAVTFAAEVLSSPHVIGWTGGLDSVRLNVINLARRVTASQRETGRNGTGGQP